jgi:hypothetical protein
MSSHFRNTLIDSNDVQLTKGLKALGIDTGAWQAPENFFSGISTG